jgi:hypothetical protein
MSASIETILRIAGLLHFVQIPATAVLIPKVIARPDLSQLTPLHRRMLLVLAGGLGLSVFGTGVAVVFGASALAEGSIFARIFCLHLGLWWGYRLGAQLYYSSVWPKTRAGRVSHALLCLLFVVKSGLYLMASMRMPW